MGLNCNIGFDRGVRVIADDFKIFNLEIVNIGGAANEPHVRQCSRFSGQLLSRLV